MHQVSWAVSAGSQAMAQASGCEGIHVEMNNQLTSSRKKVGQACGKQCVSAPCRGLSLPDRAQGPPSQDLLENQEGPRGRRMLSLTSESQEDCVPNSFLPSQLPHLHPQTKHLPICNK